MAGLRAADQLALSHARKLKKQAALEANRETNTSEGNGQILLRQWVKFDTQECPSNRQCIRIVTWNLLAQCLVRRELFPTSDCLKASQREDMVFREILSHEADVICLQEVDRLEKLLPLLDGAGYSHFYAAGPKKKHGCLIAFNGSVYEKIEQRIIQYDEQDIRDGDRGGSIRTANIAALIALKRKHGRGGVAVVTTHLFWHPKYTYERVRQAGILVREVNKFRRDVDCLSWPCLISGDFNFAPDDPAYSLLVGDTLLPAQEKPFNLSRVVHASIDPSVPVTETKEGHTSDSTNPDREITNARPACPVDGLILTSEAAALFSNYSPLRSAYDEAQRKYQSLRIDVETFGDRVLLQAGRRGAHEPKWTSYTHFWKTVLDYIFVLDPENGNPATISGFALPPLTENLHPGLPRRGVCGSDHISLCVDLSWETDGVDKNCAS